jgi:hypothetical protein
VAVLLLITLSIALGGRLATGPLPARAAALPGRSALRAAVPAGMPTNTPGPGPTNTSTVTPTPGGGGVAQYVPSSLTLVVPPGPGKSSSQDITLTNEGTGSITIFSLFTQTAYYPDEFSAQAPCTTIPPGQSCPITVTFTNADNVDAVQGLLTVTDDASPSGAQVQQYISLEGYVGSSPTATFTNTPGPTYTPTSTATPSPSGTATPTSTAPPAGATLYPRLELAHPSVGTLPARYHFGQWDAASSMQGPNAKLLASSPGTSQQASDTGYLYQAGDASPSMALDGEFFSAPLAAQTIHAGAWSVGLGIQGNLLNTGKPDYTGYLILNVVNGGTGQLRGTLINAPIGAEKTSEGSEVTAYQAVVQGATVTVQAGDYLEAEIGVRTLSYSAVQNTTLLTSGTTAISADGTATADALSFIRAPTALTFQ